MTDSDSGSGGFLQHRANGWLAALITFIVSLLLSSIIVQAIENKRLEIEYHAAFDVAMRHSTLLQNGIDQKLALTYTFAALLKQGNGSISDFEAIAEKLISFYPSVSAIALAPGGIISNTVPLKGNEVSLGHNLLTDTQQSREARLARDSGKLTLAGPLELFQGGTGIAGRLPVFIGKKATFWGFVIVVIRMDALMDDSMLSGLKHQGYDYTLTRIHPNTGAQQVIAASVKTPPDEPVEQVIVLPNTQWTLSVAPSHGWRDPVFLNVEITLALFISFLLAFIAKQFIELKGSRLFLEELVAQRTAEITETKNRLRTLLDTIPDPVWLKDKEGRFLLCNPMFGRLLGAQEEQIIGKTGYDFRDKQLADFFRASDQRTLQAGKLTINEEWLTFADDGHLALMEIVKVPMADENGALIGVLGIARDITQRHNDGLRIKRLSQMYAVLSASNHAIVHSTTPAELFAKICQSIVSTGGMSMAWIGLIDPQTKRVVPTASFGDGREYLEGLDITIDPDEPSGTGPTGTAIRTGKPAWCQDFQNDPTTACWHEQGRAVGWNASAALPIRRFDTVIGAFMIYSKTPNAFDPSIQDLLIEMTMDISFSMENFERETKRQKTEQLLNEMSQIAHIGGWEFDPKTGIGKWSDEIARIHDVDPDDTATVEVGMSVFQGEWKEKMQTALDAALRDGIPYDLQLQMTSAKGNRKWVRTIGSPVIEDGKVVRMRGAMQDITAQKLAEEKAQWLAHYDLLTELPNRNLLAEKVQSAVAVASRTAAPLAMVYVDLDHFKNINDSLGHDIGDKFLVAIAARIRSVMREGDTLSRVGGDEFVLLLAGSDADEAARVADNLIRLIMQSCRINSHELVVTASIGISLYPIDGDDYSSLLQSADAAMHRAKQNGRNGYCFFTADIQQKSVRNLELENGLHHALQRNELELYYQPQVDIRSNRLTGVEALLRWKHPTLGNVSPAEFIPVAEESGLILSIGEWVLRSALRQLKEWRQKGMQPFVMAVNLSAVQFRNRAFVPFIMDLLEELQLPAEHLELELTERITMQDPLEAIALMNELHSHGIRMSIDDFGTGYSSLNYLKQFHVYKLKIDQSFIRDITDNPEDETIVKTIVNMAHSLGMRTIAEGVETPEQIDVLRANGCDEIQGFFISKPISAAEFETFLRPG